MFRIRQDATAIRRMHAQALTRMRAGMASIQPEAAAVLAVSSAYERPDRHAQYADHIRVEADGTQLLIKSGPAYMPRPTVEALEQIAKLRETQMEPDA